MGCEAKYRTQSYDVWGRRLGEIQGRFSGDNPVRTFKSREVGGDVVTDPRTIELPGEVDRKVRDVVIFLAYSSGIPLNAARITKLAYLAELRAIERLGRRLTKAEFIHYHYGAWSPEVALAMESIPELRIEAKRTSKGREGKFFVPTQKQAAISSLNGPEIELMKGVLADWIHVSNDKLVAATKTSPPFTWTKFGERIPFDEYKVFAEQFRKAREKKLEDVTVLSTDEDVRDFIKALT